jgi:AraC-like DNA-binding protein
MKKADLLYEQHLVINECLVLPGKEWAPQSSGWTVIRVQHGVGYWLEPQSSIEIEAGMVLMVAAGMPGRILASQLNKLSLFYFNVIPGRLTGLIKFGERDFLDRLAGQGLRALAADNPIALKLEELRGSGDGSKLLFRLMLLKLFLEALGKELEHVMVRRQNGGTKERLRSFLAGMPPDTLLETNFRELARMLHCTPRHLSRTFYESVGTSFRDKRAEIQLMRARELLANSNSKIVDVAMESGYKSLSLFNMMFARHFGTSPGRWRQQNATNRERKAGEASRSFSNSRENSEGFAAHSESGAGR